MYPVRRQRRPSPTAPLAASLLLAALTGPPAGGGTPPPGFVETVLVPAAELSLPVAIAWEPGSGDLWILEKGAGVAEGQARVLERDAGPGPLATALSLDCVDSRGERGLLGVAFHPGYLGPGGAERKVYLFYTRRIAGSGDCAIGSEPAATRIRVSRFDESGGMLSGEEVIWEGPDLDSATNHNGGTLRFAPDGTLFVSVGDNATHGDPEPLARDLGDPRGKLLRLGADGSIPADNPFVGQPDVLPEIWAWGLRNPFRFSVDGDSEAPVIADVGAGQWEAVYLGVAGADFGFPCFEGSHPFLACDPEPPVGSVTQPIYEYHHFDETPPVSGRSITGGPVYRHAAALEGAAPGFPGDYQGSYFFADYVAGWIRRGRIDPGAGLVEVEMFIPDAGDVVDLAVSPDGCLTWVGIGGQGVRDVCYAGGDNSQPRARAAAAPSSGLAPLDVQLTGSGSSDPDLDPLAFSWDLGDSSASTLADPSHRYDLDGVYLARLTVDDQQGAANSTDSAPALRIVVGNRAPVPTIEAPPAGARYDAGETIAFAGSAADPDEGPLDPARLSWTVVFHHAGHSHPFLGPIAGVDAGTFTIPASGEESTDVFYRVHLTATDSGGSAAASELSATTQVDLLPNVTALTLAASPAGYGLVVELDNQPAVAPATWQSVAGFPRTIGAPTPQTAGGRDFTFDSWSDGGAAEHQITTPATAATWTAHFSTACLGPDELVLADRVVTGPEEHEACLAITAGPGFEVAAGGDLRLTTGGEVILVDGFAVTAGGRVAIVTLTMN